MPKVEETCWKDLDVGECSFRETWCFSAKWERVGSRLRGNGLVGGDSVASGSKMDFL